MLSRANSVLWMQQDERESSHQNNNNNNGANHNEQQQQQLVVDPTARVGAVDDMANSLSSFKSMLDVDDDDGDHNWFLPHATHHHSNNSNQLSFSTNHQIHHHNHNNLGLLQQVLPVDSSNSSCSPSSASVFNNNNSNHPLLDPSQVHYFLHPKPALPSILNPLDPSSFDLGGVLTGFNDLASSQTHLGSPNLTHPDPHLSHFSTTHLLQLPAPTTNAGNGFGSPGFPGFEEGSGTSSLFLNRSKLLKPLDNFASIGAQPTLFQKRALRKSLTHDPNTCNLGGELAANDKKRKSSAGSWDDMDNLSFDGSGLGYDSDDLTENNNTNSKFDQESVKNGGTSSNANSTVTGGVGDQKGGKKKGLPAKNLMAERRRRKKLNDRLYMLRSVVPKISKMDRASILGDAIEYLKELLQKINDLHNELEATPASSSLTPTTGFYPLTPTPPTLPGRIKEELCPSSLPSPTGQPVRVEVRLREGRAVNIHMFCNRRPGLLLSTMRALDNLGLDIQQAVISCFNGFALDIFRAEQCKEGQDVHPDQIKAVLLDSAGFHGTV